MWQLYNLEDFNELTSTMYKTPSFIDLKISKLKSQNVELQICYNQLDCDQGT